MVEEWGASGETVLHPFSGEVDPHRQDWGRETFGGRDHVHVRASRSTAARLGAVPPSGSVGTFAARPCGTSTDGPVAVGERAETEAARPPAAAAPHPLKGWASPGTKPSL